MPDITLCTTRHCPARKTCYRYRGVSNGVSQSWASFKPNYEGKCPDFIEIHQATIDRDGLADLEKLDKMHAQSIKMHNTEPENSPYFT